MRKTILTILNYFLKVYVKIKIWTITLTISAQVGVFAPLKQFSVTVWTCEEPWLAFLFFLFPFFSFLFLFFFFKGNCWEITYPAQLRIRVGISRPKCPRGGQLCLCLLSWLHQSPSPGQVLVHFGDLLAATLQHPPLPAPHLQTESQVKNEYQPSFKCCPGALNHLFLFSVPAWCNHHFLMISVRVVK